MRKYNFKSDFQITINPTDKDGNIVNPKWDWEYVLMNGNKTYTCSQIDGVLHSCRMVDGQIVCSIDNHGFAPGIIKGKFINYIPNIEFNDGNEKIVTPKDPDIELVCGKGDELYYTIDMIMPYAIVDAWQMAVDSGYKGTKSEFVEALANINSYLVEDALSLSSVNPVQNKVVTEELGKKADKDRVYPKEAIDDIVGTKAQVIYAHVSFMDDGYCTSFDKDAILNEIQEEGNIVVWVINNSYIPVYVDADENPFGVYYDQKDLSVSCYTLKEQSLITVDKVRLQTLLEIANSIEADSDSIATSNAVYQHVLAASSDLSASLQRKIDNGDSALKKAIDGKADASALSGYLPLTGGTMGGDIYTGKSGKIYLKNSTGSYLYTLDYNSMSTIYNNVSDLMKSMSEKQDISKLAKINGKSLNNGGKNIEIDTSVTFEDVSNALGYIPADRDSFEDVCRNQNDEDWKAKSIFVDRLMLRGDDIDGDLRFDAWTNEFYMNDLPIASKEYVEQEVLKAKYDDTPIKKEISDNKASVEASLAAKQGKLVSGANIKTINGESVLGSGDLQITGTTKQSITEALGFTPVEYTAGENISIDGGVISASGGGGVDIVKSLQACWWGTNTYVIGYPKDVTPATVDGYTNVAIPNGEKNIVVMHGTSWTRPTTITQFAGATDYYVVGASGITAIKFNGNKTIETFAGTGIDTASVTDMNCMFNNCSSLASLDLSGWDTASVTNMNYMFYSCSSLTSLDLSGWTIGDRTTTTNMFVSCRNLTTIIAKGCTAETLNKITTALGSQASKVTIITD